MCTIYCGSMPVSWITLAIQLTDMNLCFIIYKRQIILTHLTGSLYLIFVKCFGILRRKALYQCQVLLLLLLVVVTVLGIYTALACSQCFN